MTDDRTPSEPPADETTMAELRARLEDVIADAVAGRISATEANRRTKAVSRELRKVEDAMRDGRMDEIRPYLEGQ